MVFSQIEAVWLSGVGEVISYVINQFLLTHNTFLRIKYPVTYNETVGLWYCDIMVYHSLPKNKLNIQ